jgi:hypothetical protein
VPALTAQNSVVGIPSGWLGFLGQPVSFTTGVESANVHGGAHAAFFTNADSIESGLTYSEVYQVVRADSYLGRRVRWSGWLRPTRVELPFAGTAAVDGQFSGLWMRVDGTDSTLAADNMESFPIVGTSGWRQVSVVLDVPMNAVGIGFGVLFSGTGQLLADDFALETVSASVPTTDIINPHPAPGIGAMYLNAPAAPTNLDFETPSLTSSSLRQPTSPIVRVGPITVSGQRRTQ